MRLFCALSLARKFKLKTMAKVFKKFGLSFKFMLKNGKKYKFFILDNLWVLPMHRRFNSKMNF
jgi:Type II intron maturase